MHKGVQTMNEQEYNAISKQYNHFITYSGNIRNCNNTCYDNETISPYLPPSLRTKDFEKTLANNQNKAYN